LRGRYEQSSAAGCGMSASSSMDFQRMMLLGRRSTSSTPPPPPTSSLRTSYLRTTARRASRLVAAAHDVARGCTGGQDLGALFVYFRQC
jgi:hypothetical protein